MFKKILIANRGEIALRVIRTCKEIGVKTVAVYSTADAESLHVRFADEAVCIGPPASSESYLKMSNILAAAEITNADAIHPGYGFLAENAKFSKLCEEHGIKFIGATAEMISQMGDKASARATMKAAGVPTIPGSDGLLESFEDAEILADEMGYPVMLKATAGGGGKGMRAVWKKEKLKELWDGARKEAFACFGNDGMYMEMNPVWTPLYTSPQAQPLIEVLTELESMYDKADQSTPLHKGMRMAISTACDRVNAVMKKHGIPKGTT